MKPETAALVKITEALEPLTEEQRIRVLGAVLCLFDITLARSIMRMQPSEKKL